MRRKDKIFNIDRTNILAEQRYLISKGLIVENSVDFTSFPPDVLKTLKNEYSNYYQNNFDWNSKQGEFMDNPKEFTKWLANNEREEFIKNLNVLITKTREDLITLIKKRNAQTVLDNFEELIKPVLGNEVLTEPLSKYMEIALLNSHSIKELEKAYRDAKNIIDQDGSINPAKIEQSKIFVGGDINLAAFERFAKNNPEYQGVFNDWKKLFYLTMDTKELNAFRDSTPYTEIKKLYDFLINFRKSGN
jgi:hypothetical protein